MYIMSQSETTVLNSDCFSGFSVKNNMTEFCVVVWSDKKEPITIGRYNSETDARFVLKEIYAALKMGYDGYGLPQTVFGKLPILSKKEKKQYSY